MVGLHEAEVLAIEPLAANIKQFSLRLKSGEPYRFAAGQHLDYWSGEKLASFSIASNPLEPATFQIATRRFGQATAKLHDEVSVGDSIPITGPQGLPFDWSKLAGRELWFIAAGIGLTGLSAQILQVEAQGDRYPGRHRLFYGLKDRTELLWPDRLERWRRFADVHVTGDGRHLLGDILHEGTRGHAGVTALVCGTTQFYDSVLTLLVKIGIKPGYILNNIWE